LYDFIIPINELAAIKTQKIYKLNIMKKIILLSLICLIDFACFAQLPDLIGEKASIKQLKSSYGSYNVEEGRLLDVGSYNDEDNIYLDATISGSSLDYKFSVTSNSNGVVTNILYLYDNIQESNFNYLKNTIIKVHNAQYLRTDSGISVYTSTISGLKRYILFIRKTDGKAIVSFKL
jgi:hypothetical protein